MGAPLVGFAPIGEYRCATRQQMSLRAGPNASTPPAMQFDDLMRRYFGTDDLGEVTPAALEAGIERARVDLGLEKDRGRRFALWSLLFMLGAAPELDIAFKSEEDREAARNFMDLLAASEAAEEDE